MKRSPPRQDWVPSCPVEHILDRLERVRRSGRGWTARCPGPNHRRGDKSASLSVGEGNDGRALLHCFGGCSFAEIMGALGLEATDAFPPSERAAIPRSRQRGADSCPVTLPRSVVEILVETGEFAWTWEAAKILAALEPSVARQDVLAAWDYIAPRCDFSTLLRIAYLIRGVAMFRYCTARTAGDPAVVRRAVERLVSEFDHKASAA